MIDKFILYLKDENVSGYYIGGKKQKSNGTIIPNLASSRQYLGIKLYPLESTAIKDGKNILDSCMLNGKMEVYSFTDNELKYRATYKRGKLEREQYYGR